MEDMKSSEAELKCLCQQGALGRMRAVLYQTEVKVTRACLVTWRAGTEQEGAKKQGQGLARSPQHENQQGSLWWGSERRAKKDLLFMNLPGVM